MLPLKHMSVQNAWLCIFVLDITPALCSACCASSSLSWDRGAQPFRKAINPFKANKLLAGTSHVSGAGLGRQCKNGGEFVFCPVEPEAVLQLYHKSTVGTQACGISLGSLRFPQFSSFSLFPTTCRLYKGWVRLGDSQPCFALANFLPFVFSGFLLP